MLTEGLLIATGFTGALTLAWLMRLVMRMLMTGPVIAAHFGERAAESLTKEIGKARREVLLVGTLTTPEIALALAQVRGRKTNLDILLDPDANAGLLTNQSIQPRKATHSTPPGLLAIIDDRTVIVATPGTKGEPIGQAVVVRAEAALVQVCRQQFAAYHPAGQAVAPPAPTPKAADKPSPAPAPSPPKPAPAPAPELKPTPAPAPSINSVPRPASAPIMNTVAPPAPAPVKVETPTPPPSAPAPVKVETPTPEMDEEPLPPPTPPVRLDTPMPQTSVSGIRVEQPASAVSLPSYTAPEDDDFPTPQTPAPGVRSEQPTPATATPSYTAPEEADLPPPTSPVDDLLAAVARGTSYASPPEEEEDEESSASPVTRSTADLFARLRREMSAAGEDDSNEKAD